MFCVTPNKTVTLPGTRPSTRELLRCHAAPSSLARAGVGVFLDEDGKKGDLATEYGGIVVDRVQAEHLANTGQATHLRSIYLGHEALDGREQGFLTLDEYFTPNHLLGSFVNDYRKATPHPNAEYWNYHNGGVVHPTTQVASGRVFIRLLKDLPADSELFVSYGNAYWR
jgi:hypothetical protein